MSAGQDVAKRETPLHCWWEQKTDTPTVENSLELPQKGKNRTTV